MAFFAISIAFGVRVMSGVEVIKVYKQAVEVGVVSISENSKAVEGTEFREITE
jgi:hypothetical protein